MISAGLLLYRLREGRLEVLLAHPGGPFWAKRDAASWGIPKGAVEPGEDALSAARREFAEETGHAPDGTPVPLAPLRQPSRKVIHAWAVEGDWDPATLKSNTFEMEWPPRSGRRGVFPEVDRAAWFPLEEARARMLPGQLPFLDELERMVRP